MSDSNDSVAVIKYSLLQATLIPSLICNLITLIYFIRHWRKQIIQSPQNHVILCLLIYSFMQKIGDVPFALYFFRWGVVYEQTYNFCVIWNWFDYSVTTVNFQTFAWCSIERHLFIFHSQWMKKKWFLILFHYIPLIVCLLYTPIFYLYYIFFPPLCVNEWDYEVLFCGGACYLLSIPVVGTFDWLFNCGFPTFIAILASFLLCCRVIWQKIKNRQPIRWRKQRRMILQLNSIAVIFLIFEVPSVIVGTIETLWDPLFALDFQNNILLYSSYFLNQFLPFAIVSSLPGIGNDVKRCIEYIKMCFNLGRPTQRVVPTNTDGNRNPSAPT